MFSKDLEEFPIYIVGDSQSALQALKGSSIDIHLRSVFSKSADLCMDLSNKFPKTTLKFVWLPAPLNVSDLNSKVESNIIETTNSEKWRVGPPQFQNRQFMEKKIFAMFDKNTKAFTMTQCMPPIKDVPL